MTRNLILFFFLNLTYSTTVSAQSGKYATTDTFALKLGALENFNVATIADTLTRGFAEKSDKARAIFCWIAHNIALDLKATRGNDQKKSDPVDVIQLRRATPAGYALLVQEMCSMANIRCLTVDGYVKNNAEDINNKADEINHSWNVVQLGQSPEEWFYIDAAKASGYTDSRMTIFTKSYTGEYFFSDRALFNLDHFPDNSAWQMGGGPKNLKEFYGLPVISNAAYVYGVQKPDPRNGFIKTKTTNKVDFSFTYNTSNPIKNIFLLMGPDKKLMKPVPMNFKEENGEIKFSYQFKNADSYPVRIIANEKEIFQYFIEVAD